MRTAERGLRVSAAVLLVAMGTWAAPFARAVTPPAVDPSLLPPPRSPAPTAPTEPTGACHPVAGAVHASGHAQLTGFGVSALRPLSRGSGQTVAVIDTGVARHRLLPRLTAGGDYVATGDGTQDCDGHGTIVAGIIAAVPPDDDPRHVRRHRAGRRHHRDTAVQQRVSSFRRQPGDGCRGCGHVRRWPCAPRRTWVPRSSTSRPWHAFPQRTTIADGALGAALAYAVDVKNAVVVAAAGNVGGAGQCAQQNPTPDAAASGLPDWDDVTVVVSPSWYDDYVLTVGSVAPDGRPSRFTLAGPWVDVAAPGESVLSLSAEGDGLVDTVAGSPGAEPISGTSYAAPVVSGIAALIRARAPHLTARQVMRRIEDTAHHPSAGWNPFVGSGVVDPLAAAERGRRERPRAIPSPRGFGSATRRRRGRGSARPHCGVRRRGGMCGGGHDRRDAVGGLATTAACARHARLTPRRR